MKDKGWFKEICQKARFDLSESQLLQLEHYVQLLREWNSRVNLISRKDEENIWENHIFQSASFLFKVEFDCRSRFLDLGTGGGLPGIPLRILVPDIDITLLDSIAKKVKVVKEIVSVLQLRSVDVVCGRAEDIGKLVAFEGKFDFVVCRAVTELRKLVEWACPFLKKGVKEGSGRGDRLHICSGKLLALKGGILEKEIDDLNAKGSRSGQSFKYQIGIQVIDLNSGIGESDIKEKKLVIVDFARRISCI